MPGNPRLFRHDPKFATCRVMIGDEVGGRDAMERGICDTHARRKRAGKPGGPIRRWGTKGCEWKGCEGEHSGRGYCERHYKMLRGR